MRPRPCYTSCPLPLFFIGRWILRLGRVFAFAGWLAWLGLGMMEDCPIIPSSFILIQDWPSLALGACSSDSALAGALLVVSQG